MKKPEPKTLQKNMVHPYSLRLQTTLQQRHRETQRR